MERIHLVSKVTHPANTTSRVTALAGRSCCRRQHHEEVGERRSCYGPGKAVDSVTKPNVKKKRRRTWNETKLSCSRKLFDLITKTHLIRGHFIWYITNLKEHTKVIKPDVMPAKSKNRPPGSDGASTFVLQKFAGTAE